MSHRSDVRQDALHAGFPLPSEQAPRTVVAFHNANIPAHQNAPARDRTSQTNSALAELMKCDCGMSCPPSRDILLPSRLMRRTLHVAGCSLTTEEGAFRCSGRWQNVSPL